MRSGMLLLLRAGGARVPPPAPGPGRGPLRRTRPLFVGPGFTEMQRILNEPQQESKAAEEETAVAKKWDVEAAAERAFKVSGTDDLPAASRHAGVLILRAIIVQSSLMTFVCPLWLGFGWAGVTSTAACLAAMTVAHLQMGQCCFALRIHMQKGMDPGECRIVATTMQSPWTVASRTVQIPLRSLADVCASLDGRWRMLSYRQYGRLHKLHLSTCEADAAAAVPFIVSVRRHLERVDPSLRKMRVALCAPAPDPSGLRWMRSRSDICDVSPTDPFPRVNESFDSGTAAAAHGSGGNTSANTN
eukprot:TRINITY_DN4776_c0_g1_i1.p1 TRINITY_DN4776_c0_g1~~TRINITY_DN4776_c0_g1_i1.p1  ORF type:complete len:302 (+),score=85.65 TRINITY_DN4776_c0_g1_i1:61-966(+)